MTNCTGVHCTHNPEPSNLATVYDLWPVDGTPADTTDYA